MNVIARSPKGRRGDLPLSCYSTKQGIEQGFNADCHAPNGAHNDELQLQQAK
jgi:hypothetical protein